MSNQKRKRKARDAVIGLLVALGPFAFKQYTVGNEFVAGTAVATMVLLVALYRYADALIIEAASEVSDPDELKPIIRRIARWVRSASKKVRQKHTKK